MDYKNGKVYRLICNITGLQYIGSTTQDLSKRKYLHKTNYNTWLNNKHSYVTSYEIVSGGEYDIFLVENYPCSSKEQLRSRERYWIENTINVNKNKPIQTEEELNEYRKKYREEHKVQIKEYLVKYRQEHKEEHKEYQKNYREDHKEENKEYQKNYRGEHEEEKKNYDKQYYEENKVKMLKKWAEKVKCECGCEVRRNGLSDHLKTKKHQDLLSK